MNKLIKNIAVLGFTTCLASQAHAAGFYIQEQSVSGLGSAFAGQPAMPRDASIIYFNPAGMTYLEGRNGNIGVHVIAPFADVDDTGSGGLSAGGEDSDNAYEPTPVPNLHYSHQINDRVWGGISVTAPFGLGNEYDDDFFGRYDSLKSELMTVNVQPSIAMKVNDKLSIGAGVDIQYADAELTAQTFVGGGTPGILKLTGDDISVGFNVGAIYEITDATRADLTYRSQINHRLDGEVEFSGTGTAADGVTPGFANLNLPEMVNFGLTHELTEYTTLLGGVTWFGWSNFEDITARYDAGSGLPSIEQNYKNTWAVNIGVEHEYSPEWTFRGGLQYDETPTQDGFRSTRTPDGDRIWVSGGATYNINDAWSLDLAATYINVSEEDINLTRNSGGATINAESSADIAIGAVGLNYKF